MLTPPPPFYAPEEACVFSTVPSRDVSPSTRDVQHTEGQESEEKSLPP